MMDFSDAYYCFQHKLIPQTFFEDKVKFVNALAAHNTKVLFDGLNAVFNHFGIENPFTEDMFGVEVMQYSKNDIIIKVSFPEPTEVTDCSCAYLLFDPKCKKQMYFCVEKGEDGFLLTRWTKNDRHISYGSCLPEDKDALSKSLQIYLGEH